MAPGGRDQGGFTKEARFSEALRKGKPNGLRVRAEILRSGTLANGTGRQKQNGVNKLHEGRPTDAVCDVDHLDRP